MTEAGNRILARILERSLDVAEEDVRFLETGLAVIQRRLAEPGFSVDELASDLGMSRSWLHRKLVGLVGTPPGRLIRQARLCRAAGLLRHAGQGVGGVARAVGYGDPAHFTRSFRRRFGVTPSVYRERSSGREPGWTGLETRR